MFNRLSVKLSVLLMVIIFVVMGAFTAYLVRDRSKEMNAVILKKGIASAQTGAKIVSNIINSIIDNGIFTIEEVFNRTMVPISLPPKITLGYIDVPENAIENVMKYHYATTFDSYLDNAVLEIEDEFLKDPQIVFAVLVDNNGYLPTHNSRYSKKLTGNYEYDRNNNRTKRIFNDETGLKAAQNADMPYLKQIYQRDTGEVMWDISAPVFVKGQHWGAFRIGFSMEEAEKAISALRWKLIFMMVILLLITVTVINRVTAFLLKPLQSLHRGVDQVAKGDLSYKIDIESTDEVGDLSAAFNQMVGDLNAHVEELKHTTAVKERIESELQIARNIQMGILPKLFPAFPERPEFDIYATIEPAREVGGDLYDFFFIDDDHLCFTIGDVSGKGVPASLFMAVTRTLIKSKAMQGLTPDTVMCRVNEDLAEDNESLLFVTLFLGVLDIRTGEVTYCNAGHNYPYLIDRKGVVTEVKTKNGIALGVVTEFPYESGSLILKKGEVFFLYTDGVTEAMDGKDEEFSEKRLENQLIASRDKPIQEIVHGVTESVKSFSKGVPQSDDITMLILKFIGS